MTTTTTPRTMSYTDRFGHKSSLPVADEPTDPDDHEGMDYVDGHGYMVTADIMAWHLIGLD